MSSLLFITDRRHYTAIEMQYTLIVTFDKQIKTLKYENKLKKRTSHNIAVVHMCAKIDCDRSTSFLITDGLRCQPKSSIPSHSFPYFPFSSVLYSCSPVPPKRLDQFLRLLPQNERFDARNCLLYETTL